MGRCNRVINPANAWPSSCRLSRHISCSSLLEKKGIISWLALMRREPAIVKRYLKMIKTILSFHPDLIRHDLCRKKDRSQNEAGQNKERGVQLGSQCSSQLSFHIQVPTVFIRCNA